MQRPPYSNIPPAHSPPLHHPVPQHVSTVPQLRSPPPPQGTPQQQGYGGYGGQQQQQGGNYMQPGFGGFMNDHTAQMGFQVGKSAVMAGQEYVEQNVCQLDSSRQKTCSVVVWILKSRKALFYSPNRLTCSLVQSLH